MSGAHAEESLAQLAERVGRPYMERMASALRPASREEFIAKLYVAMDDAIQQLERRADEVHDDSEDRLSSDVAAFLRSRYYRAVREGKERGHCDIVVEPGDLDYNYVWHCEAKIHGEYEYLWQGMRQVLTRYSAGTDGHAGLLIYVTTLRSAPVVAEWRRRVTEERLLELVDVLDDDAEMPVGQLRFRSVHVHNSSGLNVQVRHMGVSLPFRPEDKSAAASKKYSDGEGVDDTSSACTSGTAKPTD